MKSLFTRSAVVCLVLFLSPSLQAQTSVIGKPVVLGNLEIAQYDFPNTMDWKTAKKACAKLGKGWRLPSSDELEKIFKNKETNGGFKNTWYWTDSRTNPVISKKGKTCVNFEKLHTWWSEMDNAFSVRAVK